MASFFIKSENTSSSSSRVAKKVDGDSLFYKESHGKDKVSWAQVARVRFQSDKVENSCTIRTIVIMSPEK